MCFSTLNQTINMLQQTTHNPNANRIYTIFLQTKSPAWALNAHGGTSQILPMFCGYHKKIFIHLPSPKFNPDRWSAAHPSGCETQQPSDPNLDTKFWPGNSCLHHTPHVHHKGSAQGCPSRRRCLWKNGVSDFTSETDFLVCKLLPECHFV